MGDVIQSVENLVRKKGMIRSRDIHAQGFPTAYLGRLVRAGRLVRHARGVYALADAEISEHHDWELACLRVPHGVLCLGTALAFHGIGTQSPREVWMAIDGKAREPRLEYPPMRFVCVSGKSLHHGVSIVDSGQAKLRVYTPAKTVADCFKYRRKIGIDIAVEALQDGWRKRRFTMKELAEAALVCRVSRVMQPYLEMLP